MISRETIRSIFGVACHFAPAAGIIAPSRRGVDAARKSTGTGNALDLSPTTPAPLWPLVVYAAAVVVTAAGIIAFSWVLGQRHHDRATGKPYESGMPPTGSARLRFSADFYLVAMFFVIFDLESVFVLAWAVAVRDLGWAGFGAVTWFIGILVATLVYLWKTGSLDWGPKRKAAGAIALTAMAPTAAPPPPPLDSSPPQPGEPRAAPG
jgi:NADH-quinone oxidoreductase subunit A